MFKGTFRYFGITAALFALAGCPLTGTKGPVAVFTVAPSWGQAALPVQFTDLSVPGSADIASWEWDFGDGSTDTAPNPSHTYAEPGTYTVVLTVTTQDGVDSHTRTDCIAVCENDVVAWNNAALDAVASVAWMPPQAARALAMLHGAMYDAINAVERKGDAFYADIAAPAGACKEAAAAQAAFVVLAELFPSKAADFDAHRTASLDAIPDGDAQDAGVALGQDVADAILQWRSNDGSDMAMRMVMGPFLGGTGPGEWRPTPPGNLPGMFYHWQLVEPFALMSASQFRPGPPLALASAEYAVDLNETKTVGAKVGAVRTMDQSMMATFWVGMPGTIGEVGRMNLVAQQAAAAHENTLYENARLFALVNTALVDAAIAGIDCKYEYVFWRPITAIREAANDGNDGTEADAAWEPYITTPAHPEYISTHSALTKAAAIVLASFFGDDAADLALPAFMDPNMIRHYTSFSHVAEEASLSRIYGGIHFRTGCSEGLLLGQQVGEYVWNNVAQPIQE